MVNCPECGKFYARRGNLLRHRACNHIQEGPSNQFQRGYRLEGVRRRLQQKDETIAAYHKQLQTYTGEMRKMGAELETARGLLLQYLYRQMSNATSSPTSDTTTQPGLLPKPSLCRKLCAGASPFTTVTSTTRS